MEKSNILDENSNVYENFLIKKEISNNSKQELKKPNTKPKNGIFNDTNIPNVTHNEVETNITIPPHTNYALSRNKKPVPSPKPILSTKIKSTFKEKEDSLKISLTETNSLKKTCDNISNEKEEISNNFELSNVANSLSNCLTNNNSPLLVEKQGSLDYSVVNKTKTPLEINENDCKVVHEDILANTITYSIPLKKDKITEENLSIHKKPIVDAPKTNERKHARASSYNEMNTSSRPSDYEEVFMPSDAPTKYYNMSKGMLNVTKNKRKDHIYESIDEMYNQVMLTKTLTTSLSVPDEVILSQKSFKNFFFKNKTFGNSEGKKLAKLNEAPLYEEIICSFVSRNSIIENFLKGEIDYIEHLDRLSNYYLVFHSEICNQFNKLLEIVLQLKCCHEKVVQDLKPKISKDDIDIVVGDDLKEFAIFNYKYTKDYLEIYCDIIQLLQKCNDEYDILRLFCLDKDKFPELLGLLNRPIIQIQNTVAFFDELLKNSKPDDEDKKQINQALAIGKEFLEDIPNITDSCLLNQMPKRNSYVVEIGKTEKKVSYIVLFSDVIACQRIPCCKKNKYSWIIPIMSVDIELSQNQESFSTKKQDINDLQILIDKAHFEEEQSKKSSSNKHSEAYQKKLEKLDQQLLLQLSELPLNLVDTASNRRHQLLFSSEYDKHMWVYEINQCKQIRTDKICTDYNSHRLTNHQTVKSPRFLSSESTIDFINGNINISIQSLGQTTNSKCELSQDKSSHYTEIRLDLSLCVSIEIDYYGYYLKQACTKKVPLLNPVWNETFDIDIDGASAILFILYEVGDKYLPLGRALLDLSEISNYNLQKETIIKLSNGEQLKTMIKLTPKKFMTRRIQPITPGSIFGVHLDAIKDTDNNGIPNFVILCVNEIESKGLDEIGLYRISGLSKKVQKIRTLFDKNQLTQAYALIKSADINELASLLKQFFNILPEALFTDACYQSFVDGVLKVDKKNRKEYMWSEFAKLPRKNQATATHIINHLVKVSEHQDVNCMSLQNLATIWGPTLLRPAIGLNALEDSIEKLAIEATFMNNQTNVLLFFLNEFKNNTVLI